MPRFDPENVSALERALAGLAPSIAGLNRDRLMFAAGQSAARRRRRLWPVATGLMAAVAACLAVALLLRPGPAPEVRYVRVEVPAAPAPAPAVTEPEPAAPDAAPVPLPASAYWRVQQAMLRRGLDVAPEAAGAPPTAALPAAEVAPLSAWDWRSHSRTSSSLFDTEVE